MDTHQIKKRFQNLSTLTKKEFEVELTQQDHVNNKYRLFIKKDNLLILYTDIVQKTGRILDHCYIAPTKITTTALKEYRSGKAGKIVNPPTPARLLGLIKANYYVHKLCTVHPIHLIEAIKHHNNINKKLFFHLYGAYIHSEQALYQPCGVPQHKFLQFVNICSDFSGTDFTMVKNLLLVFAAQENKLDIVKYLVKRGANLIHRAVYLSAQYGSIDTMSYLIHKFKIDPRPYFNYGCTFGWLPAVEALNIIIKDEPIEAFRMAIYNNNFRVAKFLLTQGIEVRGLFWYTEGMPEHILLLLK